MRHRRALKFSNHPSSEPLRGATRGDVGAVLGQRCGVGWLPVAAGQGVGSSVLAGWVGCGGWVAAGRVLGLVVDVVVGLPWAGRAVVAGGASTLVGALVSFGGFGSFGSFVSFG